jgi:hypothetical protein
MLGKPVSIDHMLPRPENGVIVEEPVQDIERFPRCTGDGAGGEDAILIGEMGIDGDRPVVVPEVAKTLIGGSAWRMNDPPS